MPMQIQNATNREIPVQECGIALGYFDGVHQGHRQVISKAVEWALKHQKQAAVFTFELSDDHPLKGKRVLSFEEKCNRIGQLGVQKIFSPSFDKIQEMTPEQFVGEYLKNTCGAKAVFCGKNFTFGKEKAGDTALLQTLCDENDIFLQVLPLAWQEGETISSTRIRQLLLNGDMEQANQLLGQRYSIDYAVQRGEGNGTLWGFPTINQVFPNGTLIPKQGVYITKVKLQDGSYLPGATGLGTRPTIGGKGITCETFLPGFTGDLYDQKIRVEFCKYLKPTIKFDSIEKLKEYVMDAAQATLEYFETSMD